MLTIKLQFTKLDDFYCVVLNDFNVSLGGTKITVKLDSEEEMLKINEQAKKMGVLSSIIRDAGQTQVAPGSRTVIAIGPAPKSVLEQITGHLKLY